MTFNKIGHMFDAEFTRRHFLYHEYIYDINNLYKEFTNERTNYLTNMNQFKEEYICNHRDYIIKRKPIGFGNRKKLYKYCLICEQEF